MTPKLLRKPSSGARLLLLHIMLLELATLCCRSITPACRLLVRRISSSSAGDLTLPAKDDRVRLDDLAAAIVAVAFAAAADDAVDGTLVVVILTPVVLPPLLLLMLLPLLPLTRLVASSVEKRLRVVDRRAARRLRR
jgi:hypothetical protein